VTGARTGSHNVIVGDGHRFEANGAFLAGFYNYAGGQRRRGPGGYANFAVNFAASVSGGYSNWAFGQVSSVTGGFGSSAEGDASSVTGGNDKPRVGELLERQRRPGKLRHRFRFDCFGRLEPDCQRRLLDCAVNIPSVSGRSGRYRSNDSNIPNVPNVLS
jgi:hypothetical protein